MDKKRVSRVASINLNLLIVTIFGTISFLSGLSYAIWPLLHGGVLNSFNYSIIQLELNITELGSYNHTYTVGYYPLIGILGGIIYNSFIIIKSYRSDKSKV